MTYQIELSDLMAICCILDRVIEAEVSRTNATLDELTNKPIGQMHARIVQMGLIDLEALRDLRDRLFYQIPQEML